MENKTCGECRFYAKETEHCKLKGICWKFATDTPCSGFAPRKTITNGDVIRQFSNKQLAELIENCGDECGGHMCKYCDSDNCSGQSCADGIEAWLNTPAENSLYDAIQKIIKDGVENAIDIHEAAYAPDMNDGTMADCVAKGKESEGKR